MELRVTIFDKKRGSLILTTPPFPSIEHINIWVNTFVMAMCPELVLLVTNNKNVDIGYFTNTPNGFVFTDYQKGGNNV